MKTFIMCLSTLFVLACTNQTSPDTQAQNADTTSNKTSGVTKNLISIAEIPAVDFSRAVTFYETILGVKIEEADMAGTHMGILPADDKTVNVVLVKGPDYKPSAEGTVVYLNTGDNLQNTLDKIEPNGGKILVPKTEISPEMGFFALFIDTEGNKLGLHSRN